jgi:Putative metallopeptidase
MILRFPRRGHLTLLMAVLFIGLAETPRAQPAPMNAAPAAQPTPIQFDRFKARIDDAVRGLGNESRLKNVSLQQRQELAEFVSGNMLFVLLHELAHAAISELDLPVLGRPEDAADSFAALTLINIKSSFSDRVLSDAAMGWFLADRRDQKEGDTLPYYDAHGLNQQRAFQIVCYMVGADPIRFKDLATRSKLPAERQESCSNDYTKAAKSWGMVLQPHLRAPDQPRTMIDVVYGDAKGKLETAAQVGRTIQLLEPVATRSSDLVVWPAPFSLEMQTCGDANAQWLVTKRKLTLCYELAEDFVDLYRAYGATAAESKPKAKAKRKG